MEYTKLVVGLIDGSLHWTFDFYTLLNTHVVCYILVLAVRHKKSYKPIFCRICARNTSTCFKDSTIRSKACVWILKPSEAFEKLSIAGDTFVTIVAIGVT